MARNTSIFMVVVAGILILIGIVYARKPDPSLLIAAVMIGSAFVLLSLDFVRNKYVKSHEKGKVIKGLLTKIEFSGELDDEEYSIKIPFKRNEDYQNLLNDLKEGGEINFWIDYSKDRDRSLTLAVMGDQRSYKSKDGHFRTCWVFKCD